MRRNIRGILVVAAALATGCVTEGPQMPGTSDSDLAEAARLNTQLGIDYMRRGDMKTAEEKLERAVSQDPDLAPAHSTLALLYAQSGRQAEAKKHYRRALSLDSRDPSVKNNFGTFLCSQGEYGDAEKYFLEAATNVEYPTREAAWTNAGICVRRVPNSADKAERYFREALKLNPRFPDALAQMAGVAYEQKDYLRARAFIQRYEQVGRPTAAVLWVAARTERELGDPASAAKYERRLKSEFPESDESYQMQNKKASK